MAFTAAKDKCSQAELNRFAACFLNCKDIHQSIDWDGAATQYDPAVKTASFRTVTLRAMKKAVEGGDGESGEGKKGWGRKRKVVGADAGDDEDEEEVEGRAKKGKGQGGKRAKKIKAGGVAGEVDGAGAEATEDGGKVRAKAEAVHEEEDEF